MDYFSVEEDESIQVGDYALIDSKNSQTKQRQFSEVSRLNSAAPSEGDVKVGDKIWVRGRVSSVRAKGNVCFMVLRSNAFFTIQTVHFKNKLEPETSKQLIKFASSIPLESIVDIYGTLAAAEVKSCSQSNVEIVMQKIFVVSRAPVALPFLLEDASRSEEEIERSQESERPFARVTQEVRLNNRWLDLRVPANNAIMRVKSGVSLLFRQSLHAQGFLEIITPKLIAGSSEGGADVFRTDYFGTSACLAQSPQLYKQMAISADLNRVFEIGPVFRAENSNTRRHLCEFTGLDFEMAITEHYNEALAVIHQLFVDIFSGLERDFAKELAVIREQYPSQPVQFTASPLILHWNEAIAMLREAGHEVLNLLQLLLLSFKSFIRWMRWMTYLRL